MIIIKRRGLEIEQSGVEHLIGRLDTDALLEDLGIDIGYRLRESQIMCHCPNLTGLHENGDANPSFGFNEEKLAYNCFVCGGGGVVELVQMMKPELAGDRDAAIKYLEKFADFNVAVDLAAKIHAILHPNNPVVENVMPDYPKESLFQYKKIHPYLYERGLSKEIIVEMQIGFDDEHLGITIPHFFMGKLVGVQRRHLVENPKDVYHCPKCEEKENEKVSKYKSTSRFPKVNTLYGYDRLKQKLTETGGRSVIVVESPMTALKLMSLGFDNVVATFGQFSVEQGSLIMAIPNIYFWPDNDNPAKAGAMNAIAALGKYSNLLIVPVVDKPKGDAADLTTAEEVKAHLSMAYPSYLWHSYGLITLEELRAKQD